MFVTNRKIRVLVAGVGSEDKFQRTSELAESLRDAGMDIIGASRCDTPETIAAAAVRDDVDVIGLSMIGRSKTVCKQVVALLRAGSMDDCLVIACDIDQQDEAKTLEKHGVAKAFPPGAPASAVVDYVQTHVRAPWSLPESHHFMELAIA